MVKIIFLVIVVTDGKREKRFIEIIKQHKIEKYFSEKIIINVLGENDKKAKTSRQKYKLKELRLIEFIWQLVSN